MNANKLITLDAETGESITAGQATLDIETKVSGLASDVMDFQEGGLSGMGEVGRLLTQLLLEIRAVRSRLVRPVNWFRCNACARAFYGLLVLDVEVPEDAPRGICPSCQERRNT